MITRMSDFPASDKSGIGMKKKKNNNDAETCPVLD